MRFFDIKGAFMAERPTRDIYVTIDEKYYILRYSLYGLKDAAKVFNEGLVMHLKAGVTFKAIGINVCSTNGYRRIRIFI